MNIRMRRFDKLREFAARLHECRDLAERLAFARCVYGLFNVVCQNVMSRLASRAAALKRH